MERKMQHRIYKTNKLALKLSNQPVKLLNAIASNTLEKPRNAFLDIFGKIIVTFDQIKMSNENNDEVLIVIEGQFYDRLMEHLGRYIKLTKTKVEKTNYNVYFDLDGNYKSEHDEFCILQKNGRLILTDKKLESNVCEDDFTRFRLENNIPVQGIDYDREMLLNVDREKEFVSFAKGCFLGQEVVARVYNLSKPPKKLIVAYADKLEQKQQMTSAITENGRTKGFTFIRND